MGGYKDHPRFFLLHISSGQLGGLFCPPSQWTLLSGNHNADLTPVISFAYCLMSGAQNYTACPPRALVIPISVRWV